MGNSQPGAEGEGEEGEGKAKGREEKEEEKQEEEKTIGREGGGVGQNFTATFRNKRLYFQGFIVTTFILALPGTLMKHLTRNKGVIFSTNHYKWA